ncbi:MAG: phosphoenolpyruvate--protein phosphotransferase [Chlamydiales bacterium]|nr:phosphoenolpyruvate--protein phosphotransferase [Chlamydiales bacterium]
MTEIKTQTADELVLKGIPVSEGVALGVIYFFKPKQRKFPEFSITVHEVDKEIERYRSAIRLSRIDLHHLQSSLQQDGSNEAITIIDAHIQMLEDPFITTEMEEKIRKMLRNTETVFQSALAEYERQFLQINDQFFQQRLIDVKDLSERIMDHLSPMQLKEKSKLPLESIVFAKELTPSNAAHACYDCIKAFITEVGGKTSHAGLIARAKGIPFVANISADLLEKFASSLVIVDGNEGVVIVNPTSKTIKEYQYRLKIEKERFDHFAKNVHFPSKTQDNVLVDVLANIENIKDISRLFDYHISGIGLLRSEFLFLQEDIAALTEKQQLQCYKEMIVAAKELPVHFRVFDVGGDKKLASSLQDEANPALGCRSIRYLLKHPMILETQLRAVLKASKGKNIKLLLPLISDVYEIFQVKEMVQSIKKSLHLDHHIPIGAMIEVPSSAIMIDVIAAACDFISIGTNDLIQYTLAADRMNPAVADIYRGCHPSIVRLLKAICDAAHRHSIPVSICGEMASNPLYTPLLIGIGFDSLSCTPRYIPLLKHMIRSHSKERAYHLMEDIYSCSSYKQTYDVLDEYHRRYVTDYIN